MKTLFVLSSLVTAMPSAKGEVAIMAADGTYVDVTSATTKLTGEVDDYLTFIMALGNGSFRKFVVNPSKLKIGSALYAAPTVATLAVTVPTGNVPTNVPFEGMILIQEFDEGKNIYKDKKVIQFQSNAADWATTKTSLIAKLAAETTYVTSCTSTTGGFDLILKSNKYVVKFLGSLKDLRITQGVYEKGQNTGSQVAKLEREFSTMQGNNPGFGCDADYQKDVYSPTNFVVDSTKNFNSIHITTIVDNGATWNTASDLEKELFIFTDTTLVGSDRANLITYLKAIGANPISGAVVTP